MPTAPVYDTDMDEIIELEIDQEALDAMDAEDEKIEQRRKEARRREHEEMRYERD